MASSARVKPQAILQSVALKVTAVYLVAGLVWIFLSDRFVFAITGNPEQFLQFEVLKGFGFIIVTTVLLFGLIHYLTGEADRNHLLLFEAETRYRKLYESMMDAYARVDMTGKITEYNPAFREMLGYSDEELHSFTYRDITPATWHEAEEKILADQVVVSGHSEVYQKEYQRKDGTIFPVELHTFLLRDDSGKPAGSWAIIRDITARKKLEDTLRESEKNYRTLFENMLEGFAFCRMFFDREGEPEDFVYLKVNAAFDRIIGTKTVVNKRVTEVFPGIREEFPELFNTYGRVSLTGKPEVFEIDFKPSGKWLHVSVYSPEKEYFVAVFEDITERRHAAQVTSLTGRIYQIANRTSSLKEMLAQCVDEFRAFSGCEAVGIRLLDEEGNIPYQAYCGFPASFYEKETPLSIKSDECMCISAIRGTINPEFPVATPNGSFCCNGTSRFLATVSPEEKGSTRNVCNQMGYESVALVPIRTSRGILGLVQFNDRRENMVPIAMVRIMEEVAPSLGEAIRRVQAEESLRGNELRYRTLVENIPEKIFVKNSSGAYVSCNNHFALDLGIPAGSIAGKTDFDFFPADLAEKYRADDRRVMESGEILAVEERYLSQGKESWISTIKTPLRDETGKISGILGIFHDITEKKQKETALHIANQKLNLMNIVAWHDIYNKISGLRGYVSLVKEYVTDNKAEDFLRRQEEILAVIHQQITYTKEYQEMGVSPPKWQNLGSLVEDIRMTGIAGDIRITNEAKNWEIYADPVVGKVFRHLIDNAVRHGEKVTEIRISARTSESGCTLVFEDDGVGIPENKKPDLFTRSFGKTTGFGLFFVHDVLEVSGMTIRETGEPGKGTRFEIGVPSGSCRYSRA